MINIISITHYSAINNKPYFKNNLNAFAFFPKNLVLFHHFISFTLLQKRVHSNYIKNNANASKLAYG